MELINDPKEAQSPLVSSEEVNVKEECKELSPGLSLTPSEEGGRVYAHAVASSVASFIIFIVYGAALGVLGATIPFLQTDLGVSASDMAFIFTSRGLGYLAGTIISGVLLEGFYGIDFTPSPWYSENKLKLFTYCGVICGVFTTLVLSSDNYVVVVFIFFAQGIGFGGADTIGNCLLPELWGDELGPWMQALHACFGLGAVIGPALVGAVGYEICFIALGTCSFIPVLLYPYCAFLKVEAADQQRGAHRLDEGMDLDRKCIRQENSIKSSERGDVSTEKATGTKLGEGKVAMQPLPRTIQLLVVTFFMFYVGSESGYGGWVSTYVLQREVVSNKTQAAFVASVYWAGLTAGRLLAIPLATMVTTSTHLRAQLLQTVLGVILCLTTMDKSYLFACVASGIYSFALSSIFPLALTVVNDYGFEVDASATASFIFASCIGDAVMPVVVGVLMEATSPLALPWAMAGFAFMLIAVYTAIATKSSSLVNDAKV